MTVRNRQNWATVRLRSVLRRQGLERKKSAPGFMAPLLPGIEPRPAPPSKADLRQQAAEALDEWQEKQKGGRS
jgi:hypothetical protein